MERLDAFMARANAAYYATHDPFADFTTAPEITQAFGEVLGAWAAITWTMMGRPDPVLLVECGTGPGDVDGRRAAGGGAGGARVPRGRAGAFHREFAAAAGDPGGGASGCAWHGELGTLPPGPMILLANEFLDALPIRQFVRRAGGWCELFVADGAWVEVPAEAPAGATGDVWEMRDPGLAVWLGARLRGQGGAALFLDYGPGASGPGDSLQALRDGQPVDPLVEAGSADLTAHVDFQAFAGAAGVPAYGPLPQGKFLTRLGLFQRIDRLARTQQPRVGWAMIEAGRRLAEPDRMGALFKAMALTQPGLPVPAGFEEEVDVTLK